MAEELSPDWMMEIAATQSPTQMMNAVSIAKDFLASLEPETPYFYEELPELEGLK